MNPPADDAGNTAFAIGDDRASVRDDDWGEESGPLPPGMARAYRLDVLGSSGWWPEALYRGFELFVTALD